MDSELDISSFAARAALEVDLVSLGRGAEVDVDRHLEPFKKWLCVVSRIWKQTIKDKYLPRLWGEPEIVSRTLGHVRPNPGDEVGDVFPELNRQLTEYLCTLQAICHDSSGSFDANGLGKLRAFCVELSRIAGALEPPWKDRLVA